MKMARWLDIGITSDVYGDGYQFGISIINLLGTIKWTQNHFLRKQLKEGISRTDYYLRPNEMMFVNLVIDSVSIATRGDSLVYYEMYNVIPLEKIPSQASSQDSALVVELSDGTYLFPSGGNYKLIDLLGDGDTTYTITEENYSEYAIEGNSPFETNQPMYLRLGISKRWKDQGVVAVDLVTGFSNRLSSSSTWRLSLGAEITRFKNKFLRMGYSLGGEARKSLSFGYGATIGRLYFDLGISLNGGFSLNGAKGIALASGIIWQFN